MIALLAAAAFSGLWDTSYGRLRLVEDEGVYAGAYAFEAGGTLEGRVEDGVLKARYRDAATGAAELTLSPDGGAFEGRWRADGDKDWKAWTGTRVDAQKDRRWLYVVENRWEERLADKEYSYGDILKTFFEHDSRIEVRRRQFSDRASLLKWLGQAAFLAEPTVVYVSAHGTPEGVETDSGPVGGKDIAAALRLAPNVRLLHFGSCEIMKGGAADEIRSALPRGRRFPVSGFKEAVDWAGSAIGDLMYLNLVLAKDLSPSAAAKELARLMPYTKKSFKGSPLDPIGFAIAD